MLREIILDTETTGLEAKVSDRVIEIACIELINHFPSSVNFHCYIDPERDVPAEAFNIHGLSTEFLKDKPKFADIAGDFIEFIGDSTLIIHNASFDVAFLNAELTRLEQPVLSMDRVLDTLVLARRKHPGGPNSLDALCKRYAIDTTARVKHGALVDCELLAAVYLELIGGHQTKLDLNSGAATPAQIAHRRKALPKRQKPLPARITPVEIEAHRKFLETLKDAAWLGVPITEESSPADDEPAID